MNPSKNCSMRVRMLAIVGAWAIVGFPTAVRANDPAERPETIEELRAELAALKAANQQKDSEIAALKAALPGPVSIQPAPSARSAEPTEAAPPSTETAGAPDQVVRLSKFEVTTTQGHGYVSTNAVSGFKTNETLLNIPQVDTIITRDLLNDIGYTDSTNVTQYFGLSDFYAGEAFAMRGYRITYAYVDEMPSNQPYEDNAYVDTYEIIKGPSQVLYLNASLSGTVLKSTKKPLPFRQSVLTAAIDNYGGYHVTFDSTGPLVESGGAKISYRLVVAAKGGHDYFQNVKDENQMIFPVLQADFKTTTVRVYWNFQNILHKTGGESLITPSGELWTGAGRDNENFLQNSMERFQSNRFFADLLQRISDNWENRLEVGMWTLKRYNPVSYVAAVNWGAQTETFNSRLNNIRYSYWAILDDVQGHYQVGPIKNSDAFGFGWDEYTVVQRLWSAAAVGFSNPTVPIANAAAINAIQIPTWQAYSPNAFPNQGLHNQTVVSSAYEQHTVDIVPNWATLVAGWTWSDITTEGTANISSLPWTTVTTPVSQFLHRYGVVLKPTREISLYAMEATAFNPPTQGAILENGTLPPAQQGKGDEIGMKTALFGGRLSTDFAWFKMTTTNVLAVAGVLPNGLSYWVPVGSTVQEGVDGDAAIAIVPGWQVIGSFYAGHDRDQFNKPVSNSYDNSWSFFSRYDFSSDTRLKGFGFGAGVVRVGGRWVSNSGVSNVAFTPFQSWSGEVKIQTGTLLNAFASYKFARHWIVRVNIANILNEAYVLGEQTLLFADPSPPRTVALETDYKF